MESSSGFLRCPMCAEVYENPKCLECFDTLCLRCVEKLVSASRDALSIDCPTCRRVTKLPPGGNGPDSLPTNSFVVRLIEFSKLEFKSTKSAECSACKRSHNEANASKAVVYCIECEDKLCADCCAAHGNFKITQSHSVLKLDEEFSSKLVQASRQKTADCGEHERQPCTLYCRTCKKGICFTCTVVKHKSHEIDELSDVAEEFRKILLQRGVTVLTAKLDQLKRQQTVLQSKVKSLNSYVESVNDEVDARRRQVNTALQSGCSALHVVAKDLFGNIQRKHDKVERSLMLRRCAVKRAHDFCESILEWVSDTAVIDIAEANVDGMNVVIRVQGTAGQSCPSTVVYSGTCDIAAALGKIDSVIGTVRVRNDGSAATVIETNTNICSPFKMHYAAEDMTQKVLSMDKSSKTTVYEIQPLEVMQQNSGSSNSQGNKLTTKQTSTVNSNVLGTIQCKDPVHGLAVVGDSLYVVYRNDGYLHVYNRHSLEETKTQLINWLENATDMTACQSKSLVYVSDSGANKIFMIHVQKAKDHIKYVRIGSPCGLTVTTSSEAHVLVAQAKFSCFLEYTSDLSLIRTINTPGLNPTHVVKVSDGKFAVSCMYCQNTVVTLVQVDDSESPNVTKIADTGHLTTLRLPSQILLDPQLNVLIIHRQTGGNELVTVDRNFKEIRRSCVDRHISHLNKVCFADGGGVLYAGIGCCTKGEAVLAVKTVDTMRVSGRVPACLDGEGLAQKKQESQHANDATEVNRHPIKCYKYKLIGRLRGMDTVRGIAVIGDELFVVHNKSGQLNVYNRHVRKLKGTYTVDGLVNAVDMAGCSGKRRIYICDCYEGRLFGLDADTKATVQSISVSEPCGVSVTSSFTILVAQRRRQQFTEYSHDLRHMRTIQTPGHKPVSVAQLTSTRFVICEGHSDTIVTLLELHTPQNATKIADTKSLKSFKYPTQVIVDKDQNIVVVDGDKHDITAFDSSLSEIRSTLISEDRCIHKACFDEDEQSLYVGMFGNQFSYDDAVLAYKAE